MLPLKLLEASEWGATMCAILLQHGYAPLIVIGAVLGTEDRLGFAVAGAPGTDDEMIRTVMQTLLDTHASGAACWRVDLPDDPDDRLFRIEDLPF